MPQNEAKPIFPNDKILANSVGAKNIINKSKVFGTPPFGIAQIGKSFRNEITPRNFIFRVREFEQMELEFFVKPGSDDSPK